MINNPSVDSMLEKLGENDEPLSRYALCVLVAKRARQIIDSAQSQGLKDLAGKRKEITAACYEIVNDKLYFTKD